MNMRYIGLLFLFFALFSSSVFGKQFSFYHSLGMKELPLSSLDELGIRKVGLYGHGHLWGRNDPLLPEPNLMLVGEAAKDSINENYELITLDIELWKFDLDRRVQLYENIGRMISVANTYRLEAPAVAFGFYGELPQRNYHDPVRFAKGRKNEIEKWWEINEEMGAIAKSVDVIFPSLYTFYNKPDDWKVYATANLLEAKKYGKPIIAYLWPQYHSRIAKKRKFIDYDYWYLQLQTVYKYADGVVIWSPKITDDQWDESAEWWRATKDFIADIDAVE